MNLPQPPQPPTVSSFSPAPEEVISELRQLKQRVATLEQQNVEILDEMRSLRSGGVSQQSVLPSTVAPVANCPYGTTCLLVDDAAHSRAYRHLQKCPYGTECLLRSSPVHESSHDHSPPIDSSVLDDALQTNPPHKPVCVYGAFCYRENPAHARDYFHPPGWSPSPKPGSGHRRRIDGGRPMCPYGARCYRTSPDHARDFVHPHGWSPAPRQ